MQDLLLRHKISQYIGFGIQVINLSVCSQRKLVQLLESGGTFGDTKGFVMTPGCPTSGTRNGGDGTRQKGGGCNILRDSHCGNSSTDAFPVHRSILHDTRGHSRDPNVAFGFSSKVFRRSKFKTWSVIKSILCVV